ncbi:MAG: hypothetical protein SFX73_25010 [Kofleriaceae bacterium]|nr:hypothetical protein [Kofleriaceae bacterium]
MTHVAKIALASALLAACAGEPAYDESWSSDEIPTGKADGLLDAAEKLDFDEVGTGFVEDEQMDLYAIDLRGGDKITAVMQRTSGDLDPHFTLYYGTSYRASATFARTTTKITKTYTLESTGRYYIAVKAYQNHGAGKYTFKISCNGGPCAGEPAVLDLSAEDKGECIEKARVCSFAALPSHNGNVGAARARTIFENCLGDAMTTDHGAQCDDACDGDDAKAICDDIIADLPFFADATPACIAELNTCLDECTNYDDGEADEVSYTSVGVCWTNGFNGTCDNYARGHAACGGTDYTADSTAACHAFCQATNGAWIDDLDLICEEACE